MSSFRAEGKKIFHIFALSSTMNIRIQHHFLSSKALIIMIKTCYNMYLLCFFLFLGNDYQCFYRDLQPPAINGVDVTKKYPLIVDNKQPHSQGLSLPAPQSERRETLARVSLLSLWGTRLDNKYSPYCVRSIILNYVCYLESLTEKDWNGLRDGRTCHAIHTCNTHDWTLPSVPKVKKSTL